MPVVKPVRCDSRARAARFARIAELVCDVSCQPVVFGRGLKKPAQAVPDGAKKLRQAKPPPAPKKVPSQAGGVRP